MSSQLAFIAENDAGAYSGEQIDQQHRIEIPTIHQHIPICRETADNRPGLVLELMMEYRVVLTDRHYLAGLYCIVPTEQYGQAQLPARRLNKY